MTNEQIKELLMLFVADDSDYRKHFHEPFTEDGVAYATNMQIIISISNVDCSELSKMEQRLGCAKLLSVQNCRKKFTLKALREAIATLPTEKEVVEVGEPCPECNDEGTVEWEYTDSKGHTHYKDFECPYCDGFGCVKEVETGKTIVDEDTRVGVCGTTLKAGYIVLLEKTMTAFQVEEAYIVHNNRKDIFIVEICENVKIGIMPMIIEPEIEIEL